MPTAKRTTVDPTQKPASSELKWVKQLRQVVSWGAVSCQPLAALPMPLTKNRLVRFLARDLHETDKRAMARLAGIVMRIDLVPALNVLIRTVQIQANGGMPRDDGKGKRTYGGVYFALCRGLWAGKTYEAKRRASA